ncbi:MAG TPA: DUF5615 family PIN-like protein [Anaerolineae bacterium]|nr:DUF5615 family PIN-like protein [Anaerolineae bacterium]
MLTEPPHFHDEDMSGQRFVKKILLTYLAFAIRERRAVITLNRREFILIHNHTPNHTGIIVCAQDPDTDGQTQRIHEAIMQVGSLEGVLLRVNLPWRK